MNKILLLLSLLFISCYTDLTVYDNCNTYLTNRQKQELISQVVQIDSDNYDGTRERGSAIVIGENILLTARHCITRAYMINIVNTDIYGYKWYWHKDNDIDIGLIILNKSIKNIKPIQINTTFETCSNIYHIGYGNNKLIESVNYKYSTKEYIRFSPAPEDGDSGSALISCHNGNCELVGLVSYVYKRLGSDRGLAINLNEYIDWINTKMKL